MERGKKSQKNSIFALEPIANLSGFFISLSLHIQLQIEDIIIYYNIRNIQYIASMKTNFLDQNQNYVKGLQGLPHLLFVLINN